MAFEQVNADEYSSIREAKQILSDILLSENKSKLINEIRVHRGMATERLRQAAEKAEPEHAERLRKQADQLDAFFKVYTEKVKIGPFDVREEFKKIVDEIE